MQNYRLIIKKQNFPKKKAYERGNVSSSESNDFYSFSLGNKVFTPSR